MCNRVDQSHFIVYLAQSLIQSDNQLCGDIFVFKGQNILGLHIYKLKVFEEQGIAILSNEQIKFVTRQQMNYAFEKKHFIASIEQWVISMKISVMRLCVIAGFEKKIERNRGVFSQIKRQVIVSKIFWKKKIT